MIKKISYPWFVRKDLDGFFGLAIDNLIQLMLIVTLTNRVAGIPNEVVFGYILPGAAISIIAGNIFYSIQARQLAMRTGRDDVTALPYGINTVSLFAYIFFVMAPVYHETKNPDLAWKVGLVACFFSGVIETAGAFQGILPITGAIALSQGFIFTSMILSAMSVYVIEKEYWKASLWAFTGAAMSFFGIIHAYSLTPAGIGNRFGIAAATEFAIAYTAVALFLYLLHIRAKK
jgi:xanthine/uracil/vitamin C permease (AzgA family)